MSNNITLCQKFEAWPEPDKPPFIDISFIGCCEYHEKEGDFEWYRNHTWQDLRDYILYGSEIIADPYPFPGCLDIRVKRYFMKGSLSALAMEVEKFTLFKELDYDSWGWISYEQDPSALNGDSFADMAYSKAEINDIIALIRNIKNKLQTKNEKEVNEIQFTLLFWQTACDNL